MSEIIDNEIFQNISLLKKIKELEKIQIKKISLTLCNFSLNFNFSQKKLIIKKKIT